jgi:photosystem II stability/assembly factor-like uncharacterized protein
MMTYHLALLLLFHFSLTSDRVIETPRPSSPDSVKHQKADEAVASNIIFKSSDGGQTWQDISAGLPVDLQADGLVEISSEIYVRGGNGIYHGNPNATAPLWAKEHFPNEHGSIAPGRTGMLAYNYSGQFLQKANGSALWMPMFTGFLGKGVRTVFETASGVAFIGCDRGLFRSTDSGKNWERVYAGGWVMKMIESGGVLMATSQNGIIRSADGGENWECVLSEGGVAIAVEPIKGGFAAITCNTESETRRVRTSYDGGKTWQAIDAGLPASLYIASIKEVGEYFFCGHPAGIFRSADKGKTWKLLLPSIEDKVFNLSVSGNVIYAMPKSGGC